MIQDNMKQTHINSKSEYVNPVTKKDKPAAKSRKRKYNTRAEKLEANRKSAADSRFRKKATLMRLQQEVTKLRQEKNYLLLENAKLKHMGISHAQDALYSNNPISINSSSISNMRLLLGAFDEKADNINGLQRSLKQAHIMVPPITHSTSNQFVEEYLAKLRLEISKHNDKQRIFEFGVFS